MPSIPEELNAYITENLPSGMAVKASEIGPYLNLGEDVIACIPLIIVSAHTSGSKVVDAILSRLAIPCVIYGGDDAIFNDMGRDEYAIMLKHKDVPKIKSLAKLLKLYQSVILGTMYVFV